MMKPETLITIFALALIAAIAVFFMSCAEIPVTTAPLPSPTPAPTATPVALLTDITAIADSSSCAKIDWKQDGDVAPKGYLQGLTIMYASAVCGKDRSDRLVVAKPISNDIVSSSFTFSTDVENDALAWYAISAGSELKSTFALLVGLGIQESSGVYCEGRDVGASNTSAENAEAGLFQTSYDSRAKSPELPKLFASYKAGDKKCFKEIFSQKIACSSDQLKNFGTGDGAAFQKLEKDCPAFATDYAAVMLRVNGGKKGHYGPLRTKAAQHRSECVSMLTEVEKIIANKPWLCNLF